jgi:6-pyruvoyltetrahydropterin/6-carboxytetrahydropterin synthase
MIATVTRTMTFEAAHSLPYVCDGHKCGRVHGHSYRVTVRVRGEVQTSGQEAGMVVDFARVDAVARELDHRTLNEVDGLENSTSELLAAWVVRRLQRDGIPCLDVRVAETDRSEAHVLAADVKW